MIITLTGADFSASNIGTLSTWRISRSLGGGATYDGPTSVDKGAALNATVTLAENYEVGTAGVTVTMGGAVLSGAHSISGSVITITIASVTGNVLIKVPTVNTSTGEEDEPDEPIITWYYTASERDGTTVGNITYDTPNSTTTTFGFAIANTTGLSLIRNKPINLIKFKLSPEETNTSGTMNFAVMPINSETYTHFIQASFTAEDIDNSWVTLKLDESFIIGDDETFVIQPVDSTHAASSILISVLRASAAITTDQYINIYYNVPNAWSNEGNYITRLGLCVDLGYIGQ